MKAIIKISFLAFALFVCTQISAQVVSNLATASGVGYSYSPQELNYYQSFNYYNNPEIHKLENEVQRHGNLYRKDSYGEKKYSAVKYQNLTESEKKEFRSSAGNYYRDNSYYRDKDKSSDEEKDKTLDQRAEEYFGKMIAPYLNSDGSVNKQKLYEEIKKDLNTLFEMKETEKQKEVTKLETQLKSLQTMLVDRKKSKQEIIEQKMNDLVGLPNTLRW